MFAFGGVRMPVDEKKAQPGEESEALLASAG
jgi:hypothetical protein